MYLPVKMEGMCLKTSKVIWPNLEGFCVLCNTVHTRTQTPAALLLPTQSDCQALSERQADLTSYSDMCELLHAAEFFVHIKLLRSVQKMWHWLYPPCVNWRLRIVVLLLSVPGPCHLLPWCCDLHIQLAKIIDQMLNLLSIGGLQS